MNVQERFLQYIAVDTQSDPGSSGYPSTEKQLEFGKQLCRELEAIGLSHVEMDRYGYVTATIPGNAPAPVMGLLAHMDTSPDLSGREVSPRIVRNYGGGAVTLNEELGIAMDPAEFGDLARYKGHDLIFTDGTTLLGGDDKAGIAEIVTMAERLIHAPEIPHGDIRLAFTPDEEIGKGTDYFDLARFGAQFAYTVDGGELGELEYENFNAAGVDVAIRGLNIHPGMAKDKMVNSILLAMEYSALLPPYQVPQTTEGYQGFFHLNSMEGEVERTELHYIVRDHDRARLEKRLELMEQAAAYLNCKYGERTAEIIVGHSYSNMREKLLPEHAYVIDYAAKAMERLGIAPVVKPIRGGTDGARLSWQGLPCPNLGTGGHYPHGKYEFVSIQSMERMVDLLVELARIPAEMAAQARAPGGK